MQPARDILEHLLRRGDLTETQAGDLLNALTDGAMAPPMAGALLAALRLKGVTAAEVRGFAAAMRALSRKPLLPPAPDAIDIVGTGGDASGSLNLSTGAALLAAACGLPVIKHGNRSISSRSGSADLIEALGLPMPLDEQAAADCFAATGFTFLFAPYYHPAMKAVAPVRSALGVRTVFNMLGPLTNPAAPRYLLVGAYDEGTAEIMADTLSGMDIVRAWVVHGAGGWDEATPIGPFLTYEVEPGSVRRLEVDPGEFGIGRCTAQALKGGDATVNLQAMIEVFEGRDHGAHRAALQLQAALALAIAGRADGIAGGLAHVQRVLDSGQAAAWLQQLRHFAAARAVPA